MRKINLVLILIVFTTLLGGCSNSAKHQIFAEDQIAASEISTNLDDASGRVVQGSPAFDSKISNDQVEGFLSSAAANPINDGEKKFIRRATLNLLTEDVIAATHAIEDVVIAKQGFIIQSDLTNHKWEVSRKRITEDSVLIQSQYSIRGVLLVIVPYTALDESLRAIMPFVKEVRSRNLTGNDVTFDLIEKQMEQDRKREKGERLKKIAKPNQGHDLNDLVGAEESIDQAREQSDRAKLNEMKLNDEVAYSSIYIELSETPKLVSETTEWINDDTDIYRGNVFWKILDAISSGWDTFLDVLITLIYVWPIWLIVGVIVYFIIRHKRKKRKQ